jgi:hypothetical protein
MELKTNYFTNADGQLSLFESERSTAADTVVAYALVTPMRGRKYVRAVPVPASGEPAALEVCEEIIGIVPSNQGHSGGRQPEW